MVDQAEVRALAGYLVGTAAALGEHTWQEWRLRPMASGNNRLWQAARGANDWVVKLTIRDDRDRARREFDGLSRMALTAPGCTPRPIYLDADSYDLGVVVQTHIEGRPLWMPPPDDATWLKVLRAYAAVHAAARPDGLPWDTEAGPLLRPATMAEAQAGPQALADQLPPHGHSAELSALLRTVAAARLPDLPATWGWGHGDPNIRNAIVTESGVVLVDWEYSGIIDPAQEIAKLMTHPSAAAAGEARWEWVAEQYAALSGGPEMLRRVQVFYALRLAGWVVRLLFGRHVLLARPSHRLVGHGPELEMTSDENIALYFERASSQLARLAG